jgi:hypothetical protein
MFVAFNGKGYLALLHAATIFLPEGEFVYYPKR